MIPGCGEGRSGVGLSGGGPKRGNGNSGILSSIKNEARGRSYKHRTAVGILLLMQMVEY